MDYSELLSVSREKSVVTKIAQHVGKAPERFAQLFALLDSEEDLLVQRAAWPIGEVLLDHPWLVLPHLSDSIAYLEAPRHPAVARNLLRGLAVLKTFPEEQAGALASLAFDFLQNHRTPVAIQVHAMQLLFQLSHTYPELKSELRAIIESDLEEKSAGYRARARQLLKELYK